jgi:hypothetical protein
VPTAVLPKVDKVGVGVAVGMGVGLMPDVGFALVVETNAEVMIDARNNINIKNVIFCVNLDSILLAI